jgi:hypothetical protein
LRVKTALPVKKLKIGFHLMMVATIFLYLYSPLLDHWLGLEAYARPHTHIDVATSILTENSDPHQSHSENHSNGHQEGVLCLLDINALLSLALDITTDPNWFLDFVRNTSLVFDLHTPYSLVPSIHLTSLDPPPRL